MRPTDLENSLKLSVFNALTGGQGKRMTHVELDSFMHMYILGPASIFTGIAAAVYFLKSSKKSSLVEREYSWLTGGLAKPWVQVLCVSLCLGLGIYNTLPLVYQRISRDNLFTAIIREDSNQIRHQLSGLPDINQLLPLPEEDTFKATPLGVAVMNRKPNAVRELITHGARLNVPCTENVGKKATCLALAVGLKADDVARVLIENWSQGCDAEGFSEVIFVVSAAGNVNAARMLEEKCGQSIYISKLKGQGSPLFLASAKGQTEFVEFLLGKIPANEIDSASKYGTTPLMGASIEGHADVVKVLVEAGADRSRKDEQSKTAKDYAVLKGHTKIVELLSK